MFNSAVQLHAAKFEQLIQRRGRDVTWEKSTMCSCWNMDSGQPAYGCLACGGKGFIYDDPITGTVLVSGIDQRKDFQEMAGMFELGDAIMTVPKRKWDRAANGAFLSTYSDVPLFTIDMNDLVTLTDDERSFSEILIKGTAIYSRPPDTLLNDHITGIDIVRKSDPATGVITRYTEGTDYELNGSTIGWLAGGNAPADSEQYSVVYRHRPVFTVLTTLPKPRHQDGQDMPRYVALRYHAAGMDQK